MKKVKLINVIVLILITGALSQAQSVSQWRGLNRNGIYEEKQLQKSWPTTGPAMLWLFEGLGNGYGSPTITQDKVFVNGEIDSISHLFAFSLKGELLWKSPYGKEFMGSGYSSNFPGCRSTPTVVNDLVYVFSGLGTVACFEAETGKQKWIVDMTMDYKGVSNTFGYSESLIIDGNTLFCTPGGPEANVVALDRFTGKPIWVSKASGDNVSYCSPMIITLPTRKVLVTFSINYIMGLDAKTGELLWSQKQENVKYKQQCNTPVFSDGFIYYVAGDGNGTVKLELSPDGKSIKEVWRNNQTKNMFNGFVKINDYLFIPDITQKLKCVDIKTGQVVDSLRVNKGGFIFADHMLYCYSDNGDVNLIQLTGTKMEIISKFKCDKGTKEHFAHPVIQNGVLYIRHGKALLTYDIKQL